MIKLSPVTWSNFRVSVQGGSVQGASRGFLNVNQPGMSVGTATPLSTTGLEFGRPPQPPARTHIHSEKRHTGPGPRAAGTDTSVRTTQVKNVPPARSVRPGRLVKNWDGKDKCVASQKGTEDPQRDSTRSGADCPQGSWETH